MPLTFLPFMLLIVPILEISLFIVVGGEIGALWTIGLVLFTAILGSILLRIEGFRTFAQIREKMNAGQIPGEELAKGAMILVAGVLLLTPGFLTDSIGFALFVPMVRKAIWVFLASRFSVQGMGQNMGGGGFSQSGDAGSRNYEADIVDLDPDDFKEDVGEDIKNNPNSRSPWITGLDDKRR